jgi:hypothetical protein
MPTRRDLMAAAALAGAATSSRAQAPDPLGGAGLYADVIRYADFGDHRTATEPDHQTSRWLESELKRAGFKAHLSPWPTQQFHIRHQSVAVGGKAYDSFPLWWPNPTGPEPLRGPLRLDDGRASLDGFVALVPIDRVPGTSLRAGGEPACRIVDAAGRGALGVILVTRDPADEVVALNAMAGLSRLPVPVQCVGGRDEAALHAQALRRDAAEVLIDGVYDYAARGYEVIGEIGQGPETVVVSTPSSGWFACAGERGPGVAIWLALARWAAANPRGHRWVFVASSGHEMESVGIRHFVALDAPPAKEVKTWLHLGAGIATYAYDFGPGGPVRRPEASRARRLMTNTQALAPRLARHFAPVGLRALVGDEPGGEMILMARQGYPVWGFAGGSAFHHMRSDTPERITGPELLEPVARATAAALEEILVA